jgi:hypothetical protein
MVDYKDFFSRNLGFKLFSAFIGILIWFWVNMTSNRIISSSLTCQLRFYNAHPSVEVKSVSRNIKLSFQGKRLDIVANLDKLVAFVDVSKAGKPPVEVELPVETFVPGNLKIVSIEPPQVSVSVTVVATESVSPVGSFVTETITSDSVPNL